MTWRLICVCCHVNSGVMDLFDRPSIFINIEKKKVKHHLYLFFFLFLTKKSKFYYWKIELSQTLLMFYAEMCSHTLFVGWYSMNSLTFGFDKDKMASMIHEEQLCWALCGADFRPSRTMCLSATGLVFEITALCDELVQTMVTKSKMHRLDCLLEKTVSVI